MRWLKKVHKWIGLLIGVQVFLWLLSGLVISLLDPAKVSGRYLSGATPVEPGPLFPGRLLEPGDIEPELLADVLEIGLQMNLKSPVYRLRTPNGVTLINAVDGTQVSIDRDVAISIAMQDYTGDGVVVEVQPGTAPTLETRNHAGGYWRIDFSDDVRTSIFVATADGRIMERRNHYWRVRDFFWMLHIMDYRQRQDFNHALIISVALVAIWLGISGFLMLFGSFTRFDFLKVLVPGRLKVVTLLDADRHPVGEVRVAKGANLLRALLEKGIEVPTICGGGGECGKCRVKWASTGVAEANAIETGLVPGPLRALGFRLACQQRVVHDMTLILPDHLAQNEDKQS